MFPIQALVHAVHSCARETLHSCARECTLLCLYLCVSAKGYWLCKNACACVFCIRACLGLHASANFCVCQSYRLWIESEFPKASYSVHLGVHSFPEPHIGDCLHLHTPGILSFLHVSATGKSQHVKTETLLRIRVPALGKCSCSKSRNQHIRI